MNDEYREKLMKELKDMILNKFSDSAEKPKKAKDSGAEIKKRTLEFIEKIVEDIRGSDSGAIFITFSNGNGLAKSFSTMFNLEQGDALRALLIAEKQIFDYKMEKFEEIDEASEEGR